MSRNNWFKGVFSQYQGLFTVLFCMDHLILFFSGQKVQEYQISNMLAMSQGQAKKRQSFDSNFSQGQGGIKYISPYVLLKIQTHGSNFPPQITQ